MSLRILILSASNNSSNKKIVDKAIERGHTAEIVSPKDIVINYKKNGDSDIYVKDGKLKGTYFDVVIPRLGSNVAYGIHVLRYLLATSNIISTAEPDGIIKASDKLRTTLELNNAGLSIPTTTTVQTPDDFKFLVDSVGGLPCICKNLRGSQGNGVYIFETELASSVTLKNFRKERKRVLLQEFIETAKSDEKKNDIRAWVVGDKVVAAFRRLSTDSDFRSNYSISKDGETVELTRKEQELAVMGAKAIGLVCAGVDLARNINENDSPCIIEINSNASLSGIETVTKLSVAEEIIKHLEELYKNRNIGNTSSEPVKMLNVPTYNNSKPLTINSLKSIVSQAIAPLQKKVDKLKESRNNNASDNTNSRLDELNEKIYKSNGGFG